MFAHLSAPSTDQVKETVKNMLQFIQMTGRISGAHSVEFYTQDVWKTLIAVSPEAVLSAFSQQQEVKHGGQDSIDVSRIFSKATQQLVDLEAFVEAARHYSLLNMGLCTPIEEMIDVFAAQRTEETNKEIKTDQFMNDKKSHEVAIMSQLVNDITNIFHIKQVIDLGAGKGYLSSYLSMRYGLNVYGIDSSHTNTDGANKRNRKLKKYWQVYKTNARTTSKARKSEEREESLLPTNHCPDTNADQDISRPRGDDSISNTVEDKISSFTYASEQSDQKDSMHSVHPTQNMVDSSSFLDVLPTGAVELPPSPDVSKVLSHQEKERRKMENIKAKNLNESHVYSPLTSYVTAETELHDLITDLEESIMVGLHTCGDLAPNTLRIFVAKPEVKAVCSVGCCYHFLSEEFETLEDQTDRTWGFPMSKYLKEKSCHIGRNARMSACLALERVAVGQGLPTESLFYRAVLQVICKEVYGITQRSYSIVPQSKNILQTDQRVGKIFSKSSGFTDYVRKSLKKFGQDDSKLSDEEIMGYYEKYEPRRNELEAFNRLKVFLAPCIEALILLDRLCYLREQDKIAWSGLVKLFDPVKSPRCYAVVSLKEP